jgi:hypothetical protein
MKNIQSFFYTIGMFFPSVLLAHGEVEDGHVDPVAVANPEARGGVIIALAAFAALFAGFIWYSKRQNTPKPPVTPTPPTPPTA